MGLLDGKIAAVTGETSGSGRAIALRFAEEGGWPSRASPMGQTVEHIADVHVYLVTRPPGQKLEVIHVRSYGPPQA
jgi:hypothetical protein